jgi:FKBP12-rapamycin complex-associated protein
VDYLHIAIPALGKILENPENPLKTRLDALRTMGCLCRNFNVSGFTSRIIHPLVRVMEGGNAEIQKLGVFFKFLLLF